MADWTAQFGNRKTAWSACALVVFAIAASPAQAQLPCRYEVAVLPNEPCWGAPGNPRAINNLGHVVLVANCATEYDETYIWTGGPTLTLIPRPPGMLGFSANDINDHDVIVGYAWFEDGNGMRAAIYDHGTWTILQPLNFPLGWSSASAINNRNEVVGFRSMPGGAEPHVSQTAYVWSVEEGFRDLGLIDGNSTHFSDISDNGEIAGWIGQSSALAGTRGLAGDPRSPTILPLYPRGNSSACTAVNSSGITCGRGNAVDPRLGTNLPRAFHWANGVMTPLGVLSGYHWSFAIDIANDGTIVGYCRNSSSSQIPDRAFVWRCGVMSGLDVLVPATSIQQIRIAWDMNDHGQILARVQLLDGENANAVLTPVGLNLGDINFTCSTDTDDLLMLLGEWGQSDSSADANHDGTVDSTDLAIVLTNWSP